MPMRIPNQNLKPTLNHNLRKIIFFLIFVLIVVSLPLYAYKVYTKADYSDFDVYHRAAVRAHDMLWDQIYNLKDGASPFRYAPLFLPLFLPFATLPLPDARLLWYFFQYFWFGLGFYVLYQTLLGTISRKPYSQMKTLEKKKFSKIEVPPKSQDRLFGGRGRAMDGPFNFGNFFSRGSSSEALWITSLSFLFIFRFCLDTFTIGQTSSLLFLGFCIGLYGCVYSRYKIASLGLLLPTLFKIGPGILYGVFLNTRARNRNRAWLTAFVGTGALAIAAGLIMSLVMRLGAFNYASLWAGWAQIVALDSTYFDSSHYGNQSFKALLLRSVKNGWISLQAANSTYAVVLLILFLSISLFWLWRTPKSHVGRGLSYSLGLFIYMWCMPETFKYSLTPLAIPVAMLLSVPNRSQLNSIAVGMGFVTLSFAGKDIIGDSLFFNSQTLSLPFFTTVLLGLATLQAAIRESRPSRRFRRHTLGPWPVLPPPCPRGVRACKLSVLVPIPAFRHTSLDTSWNAWAPEKVKHTLLYWKEKLNAFIPDDFEIITAPYGGMETESDFYSAALRKCYLSARGTHFIILQIDQPCDPSFAKLALEKLDGKMSSGVDLVRANRRHPQSKFITPVRYLSLVYGRYRLGKILGRILKNWFSFSSNDPFSGNLALSGRLAKAFFQVQTSPFFLTHLELGLTCQAHRFQECDLPVTVTLHHEKSRSQVLAETVQLALDLPRIYLRFKRGAYSPFPPDTTITAITADDWGMSPAINHGILDLAKRGIIRRVSLMANTEYVQERLDELLAIPNLALGLHFNLTYGKSLSDPSRSFSLSPLRFLFHFLKHRRRETPFIQAELCAQLQHLQSLGVPVQYVDGHHHIHLVPGLLNAISPALQSARIQTVRIPLDYSLLLTPQAPIACLALLARRTARKNQFQWLPCIYPHTQLFKDQGLLRAKLARSPHSEIIVHPAQANDFQQYQIADSYTEGRVTEYLALRMLGDCIQ